MQTRWLPHKSQPAGASAGVKRLAAAFGLALVLVLSACSQGKVTVTPDKGDSEAGVPEAGFYEGLYYSSDEVSSFVPSGVEDEPGPGKGYWLVPDDEFTRQYTEEFLDMQLAIAGTYGPCDRLGIYVKFEGELSPTAEAGQGYGPSGQYEREVRVTRVIDVRYVYLGRDGCPPTVN